MKRTYLLILLLITSCSTIEKQPSILDDSSCAPPCWNEIRVGETTKDDMLTILEGLPIVNQASIAVINTAWKIYEGGINFRLYQDPIFKNHHRAYAQSNMLKGKVVDIVFCGNIGVSFGDVIQKVAEPKSILVRPSPSGGYFVIAVNQEIGIYFWYDTHNVPKQLSTQIAPEIQIDCLSYFEPDLYQEKLKMGSFSLGVLDAEETLEAMRPWEGYGDLDMYRP